jgi:hypothetical protein
VSHPQDTERGREFVACPFCGSEPGQACIFPEREPWTVIENGMPRRTVHAARYAETLSADERPAFWENAVGEYIAHELEALDSAP